MNLIIHNTDPKDKKTVAHEELSYMVKKKILKMVAKGRRTHYILQI